MYKLTLILFAFFSLVLPILAVPVPASDAVDGQETTNTGRGTWYQPGMGNCGGTNSASQYVVAISKEVYDQTNGKNCYKNVQINYKGNTVDAQVVDSCPGCSTNDLDMSPATFKKLAPLSDGEITMEWRYLS